MSVLVIVLAILVVWRTRGATTLSDRSLAPVKGVSIFETLHAGTIRLGRRTGDLTRSDSPAFHLGVTTVVLVIMAGAVLALGVDVPPPTGRTWQPLDWLLVALMAVAALGAVLSRSRPAARPRA